MATLLRFLASSPNSVANQKLCLPLYLRWLDYKLGIGQSCLGARANPPVAAFEAMLRPALTPNNMLSDIAAWSENIAFVAWLRAAFLDLKHCNSPQLFEAEQLFAMQPETLLSHRKACELFRLSRPSLSPGEWQPNGVGASTARRRELLSLQDPDSDLDITDWPLEDVIEAAGGCVWGRGAFNVFAHRNNLFEFITQEFVNGLAEYVAARCNSIVLQREEPCSGTTVATVAEVGAGSGQLAWHLAPLLEKHGIRFIASDAQPRRSPFRHRLQQQDYRDTLAEHMPDIVICSWMPMGTDWSQSFRESGVEEYILLGEADYGNCGCLWKTFGNPAFAPISGTEMPLLSPHKSDGYEKHYLDEISCFMLQRFDSDLYPGGSSRAVSFRRSSRTE